MTPQTHRFLSLPFFLGLAGILFSLWNLWGDASALCVTEGCSLFQDFSLAGISLWWLGVAGFSMLLLVAVPGFSGVGLAFAGLGLALDCLLLVVMLLTAPCFSCLIIGLLLALTYMAFRAAARSEQRSRGPASFSPLLALWGLLFVINAGCAVHDASGSWAMAVTARADSVPAAGEEAPEPLEAREAAVQVYFSPSCSACRTLVEALGASDRLPAGGVAWYPVAESEADVLAIADMKRRMEEGAGLSAALALALDSADSRTRRDLARPANLLLQFRLWRNKAHVLGAGSARLPFVEFHGLPSVLMPQAPAASSSASSPSAARLAAPAPSVSEAANSALPFLDVSGFCGGGDQPCAEPAPALPAGTSLDSLMHGENR